MSRKRRFTSLRTLRLRRRRAVETKVRKRWTHLGKGRLSINGVDYGLCRDLKYRDERVSPPKVVTNVKITTTFEVPGLTREVLKAIVAFAQAGRMHYQDPLTGILLPVSEEVEAAVRKAAGMEPMP